MSFNAVAEDFVKEHPGGAAFQNCRTDVGLRERRIVQLVEIGGDIRVAGTPPSGDTWTISVAPMTPDGPPRIVQLADGGVATSSSRLRTWRRNGARQRHLVDPRTLRSADTGAVSCTVIAGSAAWAEAFTKIAFADDTVLDCCGRLRRHDDSGAGDAAAFG